jgi:predicted O-linked N-acetylglucosamine transferase (SPINDLY family)
LRCTGAAATPRSPDAAWFDPPAADPSRKIKLAYVAGDYREHATSYLIADVIEQHDRSRFEVVGVSFGPSEESPMATRMRSAFDQFLEVRSYSDLVIAELMRNAGIDIAIDLVGFNQYARMGIFAKRAAPIQVNYLGWPSTTGATYMDYIIADPIVVPDAERKHYAEAVVRLPESYQPNDRKRVVSDQIPTREASGLPKSGAVFCCFNNTFKILPPVFDSWMRILAAVDGSVLWLLEDAAVTSNNFRREAEARSISPDRLVFAPRLPLAQHLARHRLADVFLDTTPYNAHTTASDSLWCEVPVVTLPGRTFSARVAASLVTAVGLPNLVASSRGDYEALAIDLATSPERLAAIKQHLRKARSSAPLFDAPRTARHLETAYATMWQRYLDRQLPSGFDVAPLG